jgi:large subunit ribosomal protein L28
MARTCDISKAKPTQGHRINRSGKAKKLGGIGMHVTSNTKRTILPNLRTKKIWVPELNRHISLKVTARVLKSIDKNGAYQTLKKAGLV